MTPQDIIDQTSFQIGEYLEMTENPGDMLSWVLANKILKQKEHIEYLEKRLHYVSTHQ